MPRSDRLPFTTPDLSQADDWETRALSRVAARVEDLPQVPAEADDFGWEEGVLEKLRLRLNATE
jgi:hypothetical protein